MSAFVIVDPRSGGGRTLREWRTLEKSLATVYPYMSVVFTRRRGEATTLAAAALREGHSEIVAVGDDGTVNETVNGFFDADGAVSPDAVLAFVANGDRPVEAARDLDAVTCLKRAPVRPIDIGRVRFLSRDGIPRTRYFANIASFGLSGLVADAMQGSIMARLLGSRFAQKWHLGLGVAGYNGRAVRLIVNTGLDEITDIGVVAIANGRIFGGGHQVVPSAKPDDGQFDVVVIGNGPKARLYSDLRALYAGRTPDSSNVRVLSGSRIVAAPVEETRGRPVVIETDGKAVGRLPATFDILPRALNVRC